MESSAGLSSGHYVCQPTPHHRPPPRLSWLTEDGGQHLGLTRCCTYCSAP